MERVEQKYFQGGRDFKRFFGRFIIKIQYIFQAEDWILSIQLTECHEI